MNKLIKFITGDALKFFDKWSKITNKHAKVLLSRLLMYKNKQHNQTEADIFMQDAHLHTVKNIKKSRHYMLAASVLFIVFLVVWAYFSEIDEVTKGVGKVVPVGQTQVLQHLEGGIVEKILIREGERVKKAQPLMEIDDINYAALYREGLIKTASMRARVARLQAEANNTAFSIDADFKKQYPNYVESEYKAYLAYKNSIKYKVASATQRLHQRQTELKTITERIAKIKANLKLALEEHHMTESLYKDGAAAKVEVLRSERQLNELKGELTETKLNYSRIEQAILEEKSKINEIENDFKSQAAKELVVAKSRLAEQEEANVTLRDRAKRTILKSPVNGIVNVIHIHTIGGIIKPGEKLIEIVPDAKDLLVEAKISPRDIAFVTPGQEATIKLTAYDFLIYGDLRGVVEHVSADSITDKEGVSYYIVRIKADKSYLGTKEKPLPIIPGMTAEVNILTGKRSILNYILKPLLRGSSRALGEK
ncbi:MAG: HlyD family type I secretion periplasmic adaptor subunit [Gammaproteobacteria bacterium]|nr:HlyD family type I secretion periplasmic adaptor subunit [Gammaproteobacteria bacterium]MCH9744007.1 HlyD family type I secretion periplasmic adaptor subunit [Gammaproteobacteria bacterium]